MPISADVIAGQPRHSTHVGIFEDCQDSMFAVAYRMLGSLQDAEDVVQDTWLRWSRVDLDNVVRPASFLIQISTRLAIDELRKAKADRETYIGPWLPEPIPTDRAMEENFEFAESISMAMLVVLETLSPLERAVFVLREAFEFPYTDIANVLERSEAAVRQLARRARAHVKDRQPRFLCNHGVRREVTERFMTACLGGGLERLLTALDPDAVLFGDGGGSPSSPRVPVRSATKVGKPSAALVDCGPRNISAEIIHVSGGPAAMFTTDGVAFAVLVLDIAIDASGITSLWMVINPTKLTAFPCTTAPSSLVKSA